VSVFTALAIYFVVWWIVLFTVLPWGVHSQHESGEMTPGTDPGAPILTNMRLKLVWTTIVASLVFAAFFVVYIYRLVDLSRLATWLGMPN
jgi:predicted secreted protein